jgi:beta-lactamase regulating signal transducer with metallopeptidase domain
VSAHEPAVSSTPREARQVVIRTNPERSASAQKPAGPKATGLDAWRLGALAVAAVWALVVLVLILRLAGGWLMLARLVRGAAEVGSNSDGILNECRAALGLSRPVSLTVHRGVASPVVVGGLRAVVLVPIDWGDWPEPHRRACLLHELAHLARYDDWFKLAQEILRVPFFFHPLVHWLLTRLDRERELLCDEMTVALGSDPVAYAHLLLDLGRRPGRRFSVTPQSRIGSLPFLDRRTVAVRIERLLEDDMPRTLSRPSPARSLVVCAVSLAAALAVGGLRVQAIRAQAPANPSTQKAPSSAHTPEREFKPTTQDRLACRRQKSAERIAWAGPRPRRSPRRWGDDRRGAVRQRSLRPSGCHDQRTRAVCSHASRRDGLRLLRRPQGSIGTLRFIDRSARIR